MPNVIGMNPSLATTPISVWMEAVLTDLIQYITANLTSIITSLNLTSYATFVELIWTGLSNYILSLLTPPVPVTPAKLFPGSN